MAENPLLVEGNPAVGREIGGDARARGDMVMEGAQARVAPRQPPHRAGKGEIQTRDHLEQRQVRIAQRAASQMSVARRFRSK